MSKKVLSDWERSKIDNNDDSFFYSKPRFVQHLDNNFRNNLTNLYQEMIPESSVILDLMSSWVSHLPENINYNRVIGHGLNIEELKANKRLDSYWIQNLNKDQQLPLDECSIDACLIAASWQYLQYPEEISSEIKRILKPKGKLIVSFSNRAFWNKATRIWTNGSDTDHIDYIFNILKSQGWEQPESFFKEAVSEGLLGLLGSQGDPFFSVVATK